MKKVLIIREIFFKNSQSGQALIEFLFLLITSIVLALVFQQAIRNNLGEKWRQHIEAIARPSPELPPPGPIEFR